jgi:predicted porin
MKKSLLAVAAIGAFASAAQAQSSVTVYGILDVGFSGQTKTLPTGVKTTTTALNGGGNESTSRMGFKGTEDLGGGMSAFFTAEFQLYATEETLSGNKNIGLNNRQTFVGLKKNGIGQAAIGTQYTPIHIAISRTTAAQQNNVVGDVIYAPTTTQGSDTTSAAYTVRQYNSLTAMSDSFAGLQVSAMYVNNNSSTNTNTVANNQGYALGANYVWQKLNVDAVYQAFKNDNKALGVAGATALPVTTTAIALGTNPNGSNLQLTEIYGGAAYDFGILKAYVSYISRDAESVLNSNLYIKRTAQAAGVRSFLTPKIEAWGTIGNGRVAGVGSAAPIASPTTANFVGWQLGSNYLLSKRTNLYAIYGTTQTSSTSTTASASANQYAVGIRHTF